MDACLQAFQMMHSMKVSSVKMQNTPTLTIANLCVFYYAVPFVYPTPQYHTIPSDEAPTNEGMLEGLRGGGMKPVLGSGF